MFSFRTTPLEDQMDKALVEGRVGCFCTQSSWVPDKGRYVHEIFSERGNLDALFVPDDSGKIPGTGHVEFQLEAVRDLDAVVVEFQDAGSRYFNYSRDLFRLMDGMKTLGDDAPSIYVVDHLNPAGRAVEGTVPASVSEPHVPRVAHRHGLTLGELAGLYHSEIGAKYPLHVISARVTAAGKQIMPWTIPPAPDIPGLFTCDMYSGGALWSCTNITPGIGTARPYEFIGAPFVKTGSYEPLPIPAGVLMRPCTFIPVCGLYAGEECSGYQIILEPGAEYHSLLHTLQLMRYFRERYSRFEILGDFEARLADPVLLSYIDGKCTAEEMREHVKVEEQKWIRKAKKYLLYDDQPYRIK